MDEEDVVYVYNGILFHQKKEFHSFFTHLFVTTWMDLGYYAKRNKSDKDKYCMISLICGVSKTKQMNKHNTEK